MTRTVPFYTREVVAGRFSRDDCATRHELRHHRLGIVGLGQVGSRVARLAGAFAMEVFAFDPYIDDFANATRVGSLGELLAASDILTLHVPLTPETRGLIDSAALSRMRRDAVLINAARGGIVDEDALADALHEGRLAGAGIDVTEVEPLPADSRLWEAPNVVITPHTAGDSSEKERRCIEILRENLLRFAQGETLLNMVDKQRGY